MSEPEEEIVIDSGRLVGCRGRVRIAVLVLAALLLVLLAFLVRSMLMPSAPQPVKRAAADAPAAVEWAAAAGSAKAEFGAPPVTTWRHSRRGGNPASAGANSTSQAGSPLARG